MYHDLNTPCIAFSQLKTYLKAPDSHRNWTSYISALFMQLCLRYIIKKKLNNFVIKRQRVALNSHTSSYNDLFNNLVKRETSNRKH